MYQRRAEITQTNLITPTKGPNSDPDNRGNGDAGNGDAGNGDAGEKAKQRKLDQANKRHEQNVERINKLSDHVRDIASSMVQAAPDPNSDPRELYKQIRPLLSKMGIANMVDSGKTELQLGDVIEGGDSVYKVLFRRNAALYTNEIERIKRNSKNFDRLIWASKGMEIYLKWPYEAPAVPGEPEAPTI